jgi:hypothetical protein
MSLVTKTYFVILIIITTVVLVIIAFKIALSCSDNTAQTKLPVSDAVQIELESAWKTTSSKTIQNECTAYRLDKNMYLSQLADSIEAGKQRLHRPEFDEDSAINFVINKLNEVCV